MPILAPSKIEEQEAVAKAMRSIDGLISAETDKLNALKDHKKGLMQQLFPDKHKALPKLRFPEFHNSGEWVITELGSETEEVGSGGTPKGGTANYKDSGRLFIRSQNVGWGTLLLDNVAHIDETTHRNMLSTELIGNEVLLNIAGEFVGRTAVADGRVVGGNVNQHVCIIRTIPQRLDPWFLNQYLLSEHGQAQIDACQAGGNCHGLNIGRIRSLLLPVPQQLEEQESIQNALRSADICITEQSTKVESLQLHRQGLLQNIFPVLKELK